MKKTIFKGAGVAIITPFTEDGVNFEELSRIIEDQIKGGTDAIVITGTSGESATMTDEEHRAAIKCAVDPVKGRLPVIAVSDDDPFSHLRLPALLHPGNLCLDCPLSASRLFLNL